MVGLSPTWREVEPGPWRWLEGSSDRLTLETVGWKAGPWQHPVSIFEHPDPVATDTCVLELTGDNVGPRDDVVSMQIGQAARLPVATLFKVPNQPLFDLREDALLAYSFVQALQTGDRTWPCLLPMVRSALAAMTALTDWSEGRWTKFVVTGASKRGWTTWLAAATGDPRIVAVAPRMFDNLRSIDQMRKQVADWNGRSPMQDDYTSLGLQDMASGGGPAAELAAWLDPATFLSGVQVPVLTVSGTNDPFWCVDASSVYAPTLPQTAALCCCPDVGHAGGMPPFARGAFAALSAGVPWGSERPQWDGESWELAPKSRAFGCRLWTSHAEDRKFETARWSVQNGEHRPERRSDCHTATFLEVLMPGDVVVGPYSLTSHVEVLPPVS